MHNIKLKNSYDDLPLVIEKKKTRNIFEAAPPEAPRKPVVRTVGYGKLSNLAKDVASAAKDDPDELLRSLGILEFKPTGNTKNTIVDTFNKIINSEHAGEAYFQYLFNPAFIDGDSVKLEVVTYLCEDKHVVAISANTCGSIVKSILYAMAMARNKKIEWNDERDKVKISYDTKKIVIIEIKN